MAAEDDPFAGLRLSADWVAAASVTEDTAEARARRLARIQAGHKSAVPPRSWRPAPSKPRRQRRGWLGVWIVVVLVAVMVMIPRGLAAFGQSPESAGSPEPGLGEQGTRVLPAVNTLAGPAGGFTLMNVRSDGSPVSFSPCRTWRVVVNQANAPAGAYSTVGDAVRRLQEVTGLHVVVQGDTTETVDFARRPYQPDRYGEGWAPILIGWTAEVGGEMAGRGGPITIKDPDGETQYVSGTVGIAAQGAFNHDPGQLRAILLHELAHVVGLDHVSDPRQLMDSQNRGLRDFGAGDKAGLAAVGNGSCTARV